MPRMVAELDTFFTRLDAICGPDDARWIRETMIAPKQAGFCVNPLLDNAPMVADRPVVGLEACYAVVAEDRQALMSHGDTVRGALYPINPSSVAAARALALTGNHEVLDLAAAPGGKTLVMAIQMGNRGRIAAVEPVKGRFHRMRANLERCGVTNTDFYLADGRGIGRKVPERFDRVLLDAPCSSEARFRLSEPDTYRHWKLRKVKESVRKQRSLIRSAFAALKPDGLLLYSTCSFAPEENELVIDHLLTAELLAEPLELVLPAPLWREGLTEWRGRTLDPRLSRARRILPDGLWEGFFACLLRKRAASG